MKAQDRRLWGEFLDEHLLRFRERHRVRGLAFLGAETEDEIALEYEEVYAPRGIAKPQVVSVECDPHKAARQRAHGFTVLEGRDVEVFRKERSVYDFMRLDYTSPQTDLQLESLALIFGRGLLAPRAVFSTCYAAKRESKQLQARLMYGYLRGKLEDKRADELLPEGFVDIVNTAKRDQVTRLDRNLALVRSVEAYLNGEREATLDETRNAVTYSLTGAISSGVMNLTTVAQLPDYGLPDPLPSLPWHADLMRLGGQQMLEARKDPNIQQLCDLIVGLKLEPPAVCERIAACMLDPSQMLQSHEYTLGMRIADVAPFVRSDDALSLSLACAWVERLRRRHRIGAVLRTSYTSNKNALMLTDCFALYRDERVFSALDDLVRLRPFRVNPHNYTDGKFQRIAEEFALAYSEHLAQFNDLRKIPDRQYLGSSWAGASRADARERITLDEAKALLESGCSAKEVLQLYRIPGVTPGSLAAHAAHITRRKKRRS